MEETKTLETAHEEVTLTPKAIAEVKKLMDENAIPENYTLRVGVKAEDARAYLTPWALMLIQEQAIKYIIWKV